MTALAGRFESLCSQQVLVTGGLGFIGANLTRALVDVGARVAVLDNLEPRCGGNRFNLDDIRDRVEIIEGDQCDERRMRSLVQRFDRIFNIVGQVSHADSMDDPSEDLRINVSPHIALLQACRYENPCAKIVFTGTRGQYGRPLTSPVDELAPIAPVDANGINKHAGERYHFLYAKTYGLRVTSLRLSNTYGPRHAMTSPRQGVFAWFVRCALDGAPIELWGGGHQLRDFNYVDDVCDALMLAMESPQADGEVFNLGSPAATSLGTLARLVVAQAGSGHVVDVPYPEHHKAIEIGDYVGDYSKARRIIGWEPRVSLQEGVAQTVEYYRMHRAHYWTGPQAR